MMRIHILEDDVIDKIAAGEVVERPASVVKELVENSLDAGAGTIHVLLRGGGRDLVEVADDGSGMSAEEARLSVRRHATSKISTHDDLSRLGTFGFRGEALPSIAAVSRLTVETSDGEGGHRLVVEGGVLTADEPSARTPGTTVRVEHLFANVPARRKFLRAGQTEYRHALGVVTEAALARLETGFRLQHEEREVFRLPPGRGLRERAAALFGGRMLKDAVSLAAEAGDLRIRGILGAPAAARKTSSGVHLFVNGRPVRHRGVAYALYTGYGELIGKGRYPFACLFLELDAGQVDVNVHPAKMEVRFREEAAVKDSVIAAVRAGLGGAVDRRPYRALDGEQTDRPSRALDGEQTDRPSRALDGEQTDRPSRALDGAGGARHVDWGEVGLLAGLTERAKTAASSLFTVPAVEGSGPPAAERPEGQEGSGVEPVIWQIHDRFLLAPTRNGLLIVDQHAAHERVLFEQILAQLSGTAASRQQLLFPLVLDLSAEQYALVEELGPLLERVGFDVKPFGGHTVALEAVPPSVDRAGREEQVFLNLLDDLESKGSSGSGVQEKIAASLSCHSAIRFGDRMGSRQRLALVDQLFACERPQVCPHGRPTHLILTLEELEDRFGR